MPKNYHRSEIRFSRKNMERLVKLQAEAISESKKFVSVSTLVDRIVERFFEKEEEVEEDGLHSFKKSVEPS